MAPTTRVASVDVRTRQNSPVRIGRSRRLGLYVVGAGVWLSGGLWLIFHYFLTSQGELGPKASSLEPWLLKLHGAFGFAALWVFGLLWGVHITTAWPYKQRRWSGSAMTGLLLWLSISGYLLYYVGDETARSLISILHWTLGLGLPLAFVWHRIQLQRRRAKDN